MLFTIAKIQNREGSIIQKKKKKENAKQLRGIYQFDYSSVIRIIIMISSQEGKCI